MKRVKCWKCQALVKPADFPDHCRNCTGAEEENSAEMEKQPESQQKRQRMNEEEPESGTTSHGEGNDTVCSKCGKVFTRAFNCKRHQNACGIQKQLKSQITACKLCRRKFSDYRNRMRHERMKSCVPQTRGSSACVSCGNCGETFSSVQALVQHEKETSHNTPGGSGVTKRTGKTPTNKPADDTNNPQQQQQQQQQRQKPLQKPECKLCGIVFDNFKERYNHRMLAHEQTESDKNVEDPWSARGESPPWINENGSENERMRSVYDEHRHLILRENRRDERVTSTYNLPISNLTVDQLMSEVENIFQNSQTSFKINLSFGLLLQHIDSRDYRYFAPHFTDALFLFPQLINNRRDVENLRSRLASLDLSNYFQKQKPNSKWKPVVITNVLFVVYRTSFPLGLSQPLPAYIRKCRSIVSFEKNASTGQMYTDNLCFFRCLAFHKLKNVKCEQLTAELFQMWLQYARNKKFKSTDVTLDRIPDLEMCFETNINVYELSDDRSVTVLYKSRGKYSETANLNLFSDHLSYISRFKSYARKFKCRLCAMMFDRKDNLDRHEKTCQNATKLRFPGGYFSPLKTIFEKLELLGISVDESLQNFPWFVTFDMEAMLKCEDEETGEGLAKVSRHEPISASICSNIEGFTSPKFILDPDFDSLLTKMIEYMNRLSDKSYSLARNRWHCIFQELERLECKWKGIENIENETVSNCDADVDNVVNFSDNEYDSFDDDDDGNEAMETNECEPPSEEFLHAISKENVWYRFLKNIESTGNVTAEYNDWDSCSSVSSRSSISRNRTCSVSSTKSISSASSSSSDEDEGYNNLRFKPLTSKDSDDELSSSSSSSCCSSSSSSSSSEDEEEDHLRFRSTNSKRNLRINDETDDETDLDDDYRTFPETKEQMGKLIKRLREQFETYCRQVPVLGFNSSKYDLNLLKLKLSKHMKLHEPNQQKFVVKKNNSYMCLSNQTLRFLDMLNYLPPGTSYEKFLATFGVKQKKSFFPYEYFSDTSVLEETSLPAKEAFYSSLKEFNVLENSERVSFERMLVKENKTESEALSILKLDKPPESTIDQNYQSLLSVWEENGMTTFRDFLEYYNNLDVLPMVEGVEKFKEYFVERGTDIFKDSISIPGAARKMLYRSAIESGASFALIDRRDEDLYHVIKSNIVGGPSIIFTRYHEAGQTNIREKENVPCKSVLGYDANSLYVYALSQPMPCGNYIRRKKENGFKPMKANNRHTSMYDWMEWLNHSQNIRIKHKMNSGSEKRIGPYLVDGYDCTTDTVYEFLGCYFHGHSCLTPSDTKLHTQRFKRTQERLEYLRSLGFKIVTVWECTYRKQVKECKEMRDFIDQRYPSFYRQNKGSLTESQIIQAILSDKLQGFLEVDIKVPDTWDEVQFAPQTDLTPAEYFEEMSPLFCTTEVDFEVIGEHMQKHVREYGLSSQPRTLLVGGMKAESILLSSPLLKWYIEHGLLVTKVYQIVEFAMSPCFKKFVDTITNDRRQGDVDKSQELKSSLSKLIGCSAFGGTIMNQEKFQRIKYLKGFKKACFAVNNPRFRHLNELGDDIFESEFANTNITINSPTYLGYMILQYAKLHMLSFYFDFMVKFVGRENFEMAEMDTDSLYFGLAGGNLRDCVKPEFLPTFDRNILGNCNDSFSGDQFETVWFPRECCNKHAKYDMRTPGLMKLEFRGNKMIGLCSKSYVAINEDGLNKNVKYSLKGVNKRFLDPSESFLKVLKSQNPITSINRGIRVFDNTLFTYVQPKQAFNYFYCKRLVLEDGIHTKPLDITLKPINKNKKSKKDAEDELNSIMTAYSI